MICRVPSGRASILCAFRNGTPHALWVAKSAECPERARRLRDEYDALTHLAPWARELGIPEVLEWVQTEKQAVLIQSGIPGERHKIMLPTGASEAKLRRNFAKPLHWIREFQTRVSLPEPVTVAALAQRYVAELGRRAELAGDLRGVIEILENPGTTGVRSAVPCHGDFHPTNLLFPRTGLSVVDWCAFGPGFPLQDAFSILVNSDYFEAGRYCGLPENYRHVFFSGSPVRALVREQIERETSSESEARFLFYCFLATQACFDASTPVEYWRKISRELARHGYPGPCEQLAWRRT